MTDDLKQRTFFMHPAHTTVGISPPRARRETGHRATPAPQASQPRQPRVCLVAGAKDDGWDESLGLLAGFLRQECRFECRPVGDLVRGEGCDDFRACDCLVLLGRPAMLDPRSLRQVRKYCRSGRALVALRSASRAFPKWPAFDREVLGGEYRGQHDMMVSLVEPTVPSRDHPLLAGVRPFLAHGSLYRIARLAWDAKLLLTGTGEGQVEPVAWFRGDGGERVFYTSLGHPEDFRQSSFLRLLGNAIRWVS
jgi:hypothetical protein